mgnify:CR=1 FL=1
MAVNPTNDAASTTGAPSSQGNSGKGRGERRERRDDRERRSLHTPSAWFSLTAYQRL